MARTLDLEARAAYRHDNYFLVEVILPEMAAADPYDDPRTRGEVATRRERALRTNSIFPNVSPHTARTRVQSLHIANQRMQRWLRYLRDSGVIRSAFTSSQHISGRNWAMEFIMRSEGSPHPAERARKARITERKLRLVRPEFYRRIVIQHISAYDRWRHRPRSTVGANLRAGPLIGLTPGSSFRADANISGNWPWLPVQADGRVEDAWSGFTGVTDRKPTPTMAQELTFGAGQRFLVSMNSVARSRDASTFLEGSTAETDAVRTVLRAFIRDLLITYAKGIASLREVSHAASIQWLFLPAYDLTVVYASTPAIPLSNPASQQEITNVVEAVLRAFKNMRERDTYESSSSEWLQNIGENLDLDEGRLTLPMAVSQCQIIIDPADLMGDRRRRTTRGDMRPVSRRQRRLLAHAPSVYNRQMRRRRDRYLAEQEYLANIAGWPRSVTRRTRAWWRAQLGKNILTSCGAVTSACQLKVLSLCHTQEKRCFNAASMYMFKKVWRAGDSHRRCSTNQWLRYAQQQKKRTFCIFITRDGQESRINTWADLQRRHGLDESLLYTSRVKIWLCGRGQKRQVSKLRTIPHGMQGALIFNNHIIIVKFLSHTRLTKTVQQDVQKTNHADIAVAYEEEDESDFSEEEQASEEEKEKQIPQTREEIFTAAQKPLLFWDCEARNDVVPQISGRGVVSHPHIVTMITAVTQSELEAVGGDAAHAALHDKLEAWLSAGEYNAPARFDCPLPGRTFITDFDAVEGVLVQGLFSEPEYVAGLEAVATAMAEYEDYRDALNQQQSEWERVFYEAVDENRGSVRADARLKPPIVCKPYQVKRHSLRFAQDTVAKILATYQSLRAYAAVKFLKWLAYDVSEPHICVAHNGSGYDHFHVLGAAKRMFGTAFRNDKVILRGRQILYFEIPILGATPYKGKREAHKFVCSFALVPASLANFTKSVGVPVKISAQLVRLADGTKRQISSEDLLLSHRKKSPGEYMLWLLYNEPRLFEAYHAYALQDVRSLGLAMLKMRRTFTELTYTLFQNAVAHRSEEEQAKFNPRLYLQALESYDKNSMTTGRLAYQSWKKTVEMDGAIKALSLKFSNVAKWRVWRHGFTGTNSGPLYGGISLCNAPGQYKSDIAEERIEYVDVVSLYPAAMLYGPYPADAGEWVDYGGRCFITGDRMGDGKEDTPATLGCYYCVVYWHEAPVYASVPLKEKNKSYNWTPQANMEHHFTLTTIAINRILREPNTSVEVRVYGGLESRVLIEGKVLFGKYINCFRDVKNKADKSSAMYTAAKLFLNSLSGKLAQKQVNTSLSNTFASVAVDKYCTNRQEEYREHFEDVDNEAYYMDNGGDDNYYDGRVINSFDEHERKNGPSLSLCWLSACLLDYSKDIMFTAIDAGPQRENIITIETDSLTVKKKYLSKAWIDRFITPGGIPPVFGKFAFEFNQPIVEFIALTKKNYYLRLEDGQEKCVWKGASQREGRISRKSYVDFYNGLPVKVLYTQWLRILTPAMVTVATAEESCRQFQRTWRTKDTRHSRSECLDVNTCFVHSIKIH